MQSKTVWLALLLGASLILNAVTLSRVSELDDQVSRLSRELNSLSNAAGGIRSEVGAVSRAFADLEAEQRWILSEDWQVDESALSDGCKAPLPVSFAWTFRDLPPLATVAVEVRAAGAPRWESQKAEETGALAYRAEGKLDPNQVWEYRVVSESPAGSRASSPKPMYELESVTRKAVRLDQGETYATGGKEWVRYLLLPPRQVQTLCNTVTAATLEVLLEGKVVGTWEMVNKRPPEGAPVKPAIGGSASMMSGDGTGYELGWWTDWVELPAGRVDVRATVTFADGERATVALGSDCCQPAR